MALLAAILFGAAPATPGTPPARPAHPALLPLAGRRRRAGLRPAHPGDVGRDEPPSGDPAPPRTRRDEAAVPAPRALRRGRRARRRPRLLGGAARPGARRFPSTYYVDGANGVPDETDILACLDDALARAPIDPDRVALAGFSQGGRGALTVGLLNPTRFAALVDAAGPTDAFQGQLWSPRSRTTLSAAGGPASAGGEVLARWFELSPRFLLPNARNLFVAVLHGQADDNVPDSPGFLPVPQRAPRQRDAGIHRRARDSPDALRAPRGRPRGLRLHDLVPRRRRARAASPPPARRPLRRGAREGAPLAPRARRRRLVRLAGEDVPLGAPRADGRPRRHAGLPRRARRHRGEPRRPRVRGNGPDPSRPPRRRPRRGRAVSLHLSGRARLDLALAGPFAPALLATLDGTPLAFDRTAEGALVSGPRSAPVRLRSSSSRPRPPAPVAEADLLVPALVRADGANGARYETVLTVGNLSASPLLLEALLLDGVSTPFPLEVPGPLEPGVRFRALSSATAPPGPSPRRSASGSSPATPGPSRRPRGSSTRRRRVRTGSRFRSSPRARASSERAQRRTSSARRIPGPSG